MSMSKFSLIHNFVVFIFTKNSTCIKRVTHISIIYDTILHINSVTYFICKFYELYSSIQGTVSWLERFGAEKTCSSCVFWQPGNTNKSITWTTPNTLIAKKTVWRSEFLLIRNSKCSAIIVKYTPTDCFFGDFAHWVLKIRHPSVN